MAVNDEIFKNLEVYGGGTINERVYNFLGSLGYTGTINDRLGQFEEGGRKGWQGLIRAWGQWAPAQLFSQGQEGVWYEPKPIVAGQQVLYQDSAGTTPVTADGDPVGLMLDLSRGLVLGPETVVNGDFSEGGTGWALGSNWTVDNGEVTTNAQNSGSGATDPSRHAKQAGILEIGKSYQMNLDIVGNSHTGSGFSNLILFSEAGKIIRQVSSSFSVPKNITFFFTATSTDFTLSTSSTSDGQEPFTLDNISVRELPGNHATQSTSAARPIYRTDGVLHWLAFDGEDDYLITSGFNLVNGAEAGIICGFSSDSSGIRAVNKYDAGAGQRDVGFGPASSSQGFTVQGDADVFNSSQVAPVNKTPGTSVVMGHWLPGEAAKGQENGGTVVAADQVTSALSGVAGPLTLMAINNGTTGYVGGNLFAAILSTASPGDENVSRTTKHLAKLAGVTL